MNTFQSFCTKINYHFKDEELLHEAMTHPSLTQETKAIHNYQRLEFLGDKVLSLIITEFLMKKFRYEMEGALSRRQAALVSGETLAEIAINIGINHVLLISEGEEKLGGRNNKRNLENALEALIGAIYFDSDYETAKKFVMHFWHDFFERDITPPKDPISKLQEIVQSQTKLLPEYIVEQIGGCDHAPEFKATVKIPNQNLGFSGEGKSKKEAQKIAAKLALEYFEKHPLK